MIQRLLIASVLILLLSGFATPGSSMVFVEESVQNLVETSAVGTFIPVVVFLSDPLSPAGLQQEVAGLNHIQAREYAMDRLKTRLEESSAGLIPWLNDQESVGTVRHIYPLWLANAYTFEVQAAMINQLRQLEGLSKIHYDRPLTAEEILDIEKKDEFENDIPDELDETETIEWGIADIGSVEMWNMGFTGRGIIVGSFDTGCLISHDDIETHLWTNEDEIPNDGIDNDENGLIDDIHGWNFVDDDNDIGDVNGHGTHCAGILVGDGHLGRNTGVSPGAKLIVNRIYSSSTSSESRYWLALQYAIEKGARVASASLSYKYETINDQPNLEYPAYVEHRLVHANALATGIIVANSIGNTGNNLATVPIPWNVAAPANCPPPWMTPDQINLPGGLTDIISCGAFKEDSTIYSNGAWGPSEWFRADFPAEDSAYFRDYPWSDGNFIGLLKPDVVAPCNVYSCDENGRYGRFNSTSSATPHLGGALTMLRSVHPQATPAQIYEAVVMSAEDAGDPGWDDRFGYGKLRIVAAHEYLDNMFDYGSLEISHFEEAGLIADSFEVILNHGEVLGWSNDNQATIQRILPGEYTLEISNYENIIYTHEGSITIQEDNLTQLDLANAVNNNLDAIPHEHKLLPAYPNPFNPSVTLSFILSKTEKVNLKIIDVTGREIAELVKGNRNQGNHQVTWDASDFASGVYFAVINAGNNKFVEKLILVR